MSSTRFLVLCCGGCERSHREHGPRRLHITLALLACLALPSPTRAASVNPFDPSLPPSIHALTVCNAVAVQNGADSASCLHENVAQDPTTLTQVIGTGVASADLRTGTLRSSSSAQAYRFPAAHGHLRANAAGSAQLYDTIMFDGGFTGEAELRMVVTGSMLESMTVSAIFGQAVASLFAFDDVGVELGQSSIFIDQFTSGGAFISNQFSYGLPTQIVTNADAMGQFDPSNVQVTLSMFFAVTAADPSFTFGTRLATSAGLGPFIGIADQLQMNDVDFGNTARLSLIVPAGVTWTSSSGAFLVPEPSLLALLCAGIVCLGRIGER